MTQTHPLTVADRRHLAHAIRAARGALRRGHHPYAAVIAQGSKFLLDAHNTCETGDATEHAEMEAIRRLKRSHSAEDTETLTLYATCEPCWMCAGAVYWCGIRRIVYGVEDPQFGGLLRRMSSVVAQNADSQACRRLLREAARMRSERNIPDSPPTRAEFDCAKSAYGDAKEALLLFERQLVTVEQGGIALVTLCSFLIAITTAAVFSATVGDLAKGAIATGTLLALVASAVSVFGVFRFRWAAVREACPMAEMSGSWARTLIMIRDRKTRFMNVAAILLTVSLVFYTLGVTLALRR
jgi:tRNA(Arg) A34 adenosine deaminase TadA